MDENTMTIDQVYDEFVNELIHPFVGDEDALNRKQFADIKQPDGSLLIIVPNPITGHRFKWILTNAENFGFRALVEGTAGRGVKVTLTPISDEEWSFML